MKKITSILVFIVFHLCLQAQIGVTAALDSTNILLGDQVHLNFKITKPSDTKYLSADFQAALDSVEQIELVKVEDPTTTSIGSNEVVNQSILITSFEDGTHQIPQFSFSVDKNGRTYEALSNPVYIKVNPIAIDTTAELRPIKDIMEEHVKIGDWIHYVLIPLALILVIILIIFLLRRLTRKKTEAPVIEKKVFIPAHITAFKKIEELKGKELWQKGEIKPYYSEISYIAREYLENRYDINALESVIHEITSDLKDKDIPDILQQRLIETLRTTDMVKFAKAKPQEETHRKVMDRLEQFVKETQKVAQTTTGENQNAEINE